MFNVYRIEFREDGIYLQVDWKSKVTGVREDWLHGDRLQIMQSTGLEDKHGEEIWEGDVVKFNFVDTENCVVRWHNGKFEITNKDLGTEDALHWHNLQGEILGNLYQNPELIQ